MAIRAWIEERPISRSALLGIGNGVAFYMMKPYYGLELTVMLAMFMPGVYNAFSYIQDGALEQFEEGITLMALLPFNLWCLSQVSIGGNPYCAPLAVLVHGLVDGMHHFGIYPSSKHVSQCCPMYPAMCGTLDIFLAGTMSLLIWMFP